jgi:hypothetical protein
MRRFVAIFFAVLIVFQTAPLRTVFAAMSSSSFIMPSDTLGDTGGTSSSASFFLNDTMGETSPATGQGSPSFSLSSGFQTMTPEPVFIFTISSNALALSPAPSVSSTSTASTILTTSTNAPFGYSTYISDDGQFRRGADLIADVADGTVGPVGVEEYGVGITGSDRAFADDRATVVLPRTSPPTPRMIASYNSFGAGRATTVTVKFDMAATTIDGNYSHVLTFVSSPNY